MCSQHKTMFTLREIKNSDNTALARMIRNVFEEFDAPRQGTVFSDPTTDYLFELFRKPKSVLWVAEIADNIVGCSGIFPSEGLDNDTAELVKYYISADARGKGIGKNLMLKCIESARYFGYRKLYIESLPVFSKAISIYQQNGFVFLDKPLGNSAHPSCDVWMVKEL